MTLVGDRVLLRRLAWCLPLVWIAWFVPSLCDMQFSWDDREALFGNPAIRGFDLVRILREDYWEMRGGAGVYRPLLSLSLAFDGWLFGENAIALHRATLFLHAVGVFVLANALDRWRSGMFWPVLLACFFHPVAAEQAAWIVGRSGSLALAFGGAGIWLALNGRLGWAGLACWCAAHVREDGILFLPVVWLLIAPAGRRSWFLIAMTVSGLWLIARWLALGQLLPQAAHAGLTLDLLAPLESFGHLAAMLLLVEPPVVLSDGSRAAGGFVVVLPLFALLTLLAWKRRHRALAGLLWTLLAFAPFAQVVPFGEDLAGRFAYPLLPGIVLAIGACGERFRRALLLVAIALVPLWFRQVRIIGDPQRSFAQVLAVEPDNRRAKLLLGLAEENAGERDRALDRFRALVARHPGYAKGHVNLARLLMQARRDAEATRVLERAVRRFPSSSRAALTLGRLHFRNRRDEDAAFAFEEALERNPREGQAARYLCRALVRLGDRVGARAAFETARRLDSKHPSLPQLEAMLR